MTLRAFRPGAGLANTTALTTSNVFDITGTYALNLSGGSGTRTASSTHTHGGVNTAQTAATSGQNSVLWYPFASSSLTGAVEWLFYYATQPATTADNIGGPNSGGTPWNVNINTAGKLVVSDTVGGQIWLAAAALTTGNWYRIAIRYVIATSSTGTLQVAYYSDNSTTAIETSTNYTGQNLGTTAPAVLELGRRNTPATSMTMWHTDVQVNDGATSFIGPLTAYDVITDMYLTVPDTAVVFDQINEMWLTAGGGGTFDQINEMWLTSSSGMTVDFGPDLAFEPNRVAKLTPTFGTPPTSVAYTQTGGPAVALVGTGLNRAYLTPATQAGTTLTFQVTATPAGGGSPVSDTVVHTIYPQLVWTLNALSTKRPVHRGPTPAVVPDPDPGGATWTLAYSEDFNTPAALGTVATVYPKLNANVYSGFGDTTGKADYSPILVLSVTGGYLDFYLHTEGGRPRVAAPIPNGWAGQTYGRYEIVFRTDNMPGYKIAFLLWPESDNWNEGEIDWPEGNLTTGTKMSPASAVKGSYNSGTGTMTFDPPTRVYAATDASTWHTAVTEWTPGLVRWLWDGVEVGRTTNPAGVPNTPMRWTLQAESNTDGDPVPAGTSGHLQVDSLRIYRYTP